MLSDMHDMTARGARPVSPVTTGVVVLCDVRASREIADRAAFLARLEETLARANRARNVLVGAFDFQAGLDEFAGVLRPGRAGAVLTRLWEDLHPVAVRFAVVRGGLDVTPRAGRAIGHRAPPGSTVPPSTGRTSCWTSSAAGSSSSRSASARGGRTDCSRRSATCSTPASSAGPRVSSKSCAPIGPPAPSGTPHASSA